MNINAKDAKNRFSELLNLAEAGETVVVTRHGKPVADIVPHKERKGGIDWQAAAEFKKAHGITNFFTFIAPDFDDPLPEDFLITPTSD
jgi:prevent-host-death family protein